MHGTYACFTLRFVSAWQTRPHDVQIRQGCELADGQTLELLVHQHCEQAKEEKRVRRHVWYSDSRDVGDVAASNTTEYSRVAVEVATS